MYTNVSVDGSCTEVWDEHMGLWRNVYSYLSRWVGAGWLATKARVRVFNIICTEDVGVVNPYVLWTDGKTKKCFGLYESGQTDI